MATSPLIVADLLFPGIVVQQALLDAIASKQAALGRELVAGDVTAVLALANTLDQSVASYVPTPPASYPAALPTFPTSLPRWPDAYGGMPATDGWTKLDGGKVVNP